MGDSSKKNGSSRKEQGSESRRRERKRLEKLEGKLQKRIAAALESRMREGRARDAELLAALRASAAGQASPAELEARFRQLRQELERDLEQRVARRWAGEGARLELLARRLEERARAEASAGSPPEEVEAPPHSADPQALMRTLEARLRSARDQDLRHREALFGRALRWVGLPLAAALVVLGVVGLRALADLRTVANAVGGAAAEDRELDAADDAGEAAFVDSNLISLSRAAADQRVLTPEARERLLAVLRAGDTPELSEPALLALALDRDGRDALTSIARDAALEPALRASALDALVGVRPADESLAELTHASGDSAPIVRAAGLAGLARRAPAHVALAAVLDSSKLSACDSLEELAPLAALLAPLADAPVREPETEHAARLAHASRLLARTLREPYRLRADHSLPGPARLALGLRGDAVAGVPLGDLLPSATFQQAVDALLREAATQPTLAALHARVDRLGAGEPDDSERPFVVRARLGEGSAAVPTGGEAFTSGEVEISVQPGDAGAPLMVRRPNAEQGWQPLRFLERPERLQFRLVAVDEL